MASLLIDPLPSPLTLKRHLCIKVHNEQQGQEEVYSDSDEALDRCTTGVMEEIRCLPLGKAESEDLEDKAKVLYNNNNNTTTTTSVVGCLKVVAARVLDTRGMWNGLTGDDFDDPDKVEGIRSLIRYPLKSNDDDPMVVQIRLAWPLYNGAHEVFLHKGKLYTNEPISKPLQVYAEAQEVNTKPYEGNKRTTLKCVPVYCQHYLPGPLPTLKQIYNENPQLFWPVVYSVREISRSAKLGMIGWLLRARHTVIAFETDYTNMKYRGACSRGCPGIGSHLLLDKTADGGVWFRYRAFWERFNEFGNVYRTKGDGIRLSEIWNCIRKIDNGVMVDGGMTIDRCCQHFTKEVIQKLITDDKIDNTDNVKPELRNKEIFDTINRIRAKHPSWYPKVDPTDPNAEKWQQNLMKIFSSGGISDRIHELISNWRLRTHLYEIPNFY